jgi:hypothetical protein
VFCCLRATLQEPDHPIDRWNLVILSEKGPRYRGLAKGEIGEVISSKYKGEFRVKCPNGTVAYFREEEINYWDEGEVCGRPFSFDPCQFFERQFLCVENDRLPRLARDKPEESYTEGVFLCFPVSYRRTNASRRSVDKASVRKRRAFSTFHFKWSILPDRLGTNIGKALTKKRTPPSIYAGHLEDMAIKDAGGTIHDVIGRPISELGSDEEVRNGCSPPPSLPFPSLLLLLPPCVVGEASSCQDRLGTA